MILPLRKFEAVVPISAPMPGGLNDWPANIQDRIYEQWAILEDAHGISLKLSHSVCEQDPDGVFVRIGLIEDRTTR